MPETPSRSAAELRRAFLDFFVKNGHTAVPSAPLVPNDPTLLFTTAGMVQFKPYFTAPGDVPYTRAVSIQKCLRLTDLENVGSTPRHDTFFEMLGNFSFGPRAKGAYFKEEAIAYAWEFVTKVLGLPKDRLFVSIFNGEGGLPRDDEAELLWKKIGISANHIVALGRADNFWGPAGGQGACGPCSEIYFDLGDKRPDYLAKDAFWGEMPGDAGDRFMEFWNLVFPQYDQQKDGTLELLPRPGIDTGMGLERLSLIVQKKDSIFETDLFEPLVNLVLRISQDEYGEVPGPAHRRDARIIADHARALTFAISEGVYPGNEGAGYVLRRLLRRAEVRARSREGLRISGDDFLPRVSGRVVEMFAEHYPELQEARDAVMTVLEREELSFQFTYGRGLRVLEDLKARGMSVVPGDVAFTLHDTYGFTIEAAQDLAGGWGMTVDVAGFEKEMQAQRDRARSSSKFGQRNEVADDSAWNVEQPGRGAVAIDYEHDEVIQIGLIRWRRFDTGELEVVLDKTPCYPESGGQTSDHGEISGLGTSAELVSVYRDQDSIVHRVRIKEGPWRQLITAGQHHLIAAVVDRSSRLPTMRHHTATHLLHSVLRAELGTHVRQAGSLVAPDRLRFDYSHFEAPSREQLELVENRINQWVLADRDVRWEILPLEEARRRGAMALFGEKYGAEVRMVTVEGVAEAGIAASLELCGGTHVHRTGEIGAFTITAESAIASGVRRIEALCGLEAMQHFRSERELLARAAASLQASPAQVPEQVEKLRAELDQLRKAEAKLQRGGLEAEMTRLAEAASPAREGRWIVAKIESAADSNALREAADTLRGRLKRGAALLAIAGEGKLTFVAAVTDDLVSEKKLNASELVKAVAGVAGGSGGGKPHLALAGGKDPSKLGAALDEARRRMAEALSA